MMISLLPHKNQSYPLYQKMHSKIGNKLLKKVPSLQSLRSQVQKYRRLWQVSSLRSEKSAYPDIIDSI